MDASIDDSTDEAQNTLAQLRSVVNDVNIFTQLDEAIDFLTDVEGIIAERILPFIHDIPQLDAIYILCSNPSQHQQWTKKWIKIKSAHTDTQSLCESLQLATK